MHKEMGTLLKDLKIFGLGAMDKIHRREKRI